MWLGRTRGGFAGLDIIINGADGLISGTLRGNDGWFKDA